MKFGKELQQEKHEEWNDNYLDYKMMKKVLKLNGDVQTVFSQSLESQLIKVHAFMRQEQAVIRNRIRALAARGPKELSDEPGYEQLVSHIEQFGQYAALNQTAVRKIIKKFNKRFQARFAETFAVPEEARQLVSKEDIGRWLLRPAQQCSDLMKQPGPRPQLAFWVEELLTGAEFAKHRIGGTLGQGLTELRLQRCFCVPPEISLRVRNTFIECVHRPGGSRLARSTSQPLKPACWLADEGVSDEEPAEGILEKGAAKLALLPLGKQEACSLKALVKEKEAHPRAAKGLVVKEVPSPEQSPSNSCHHGRRGSTGSRGSHPRCLQPRGRASTLSSLGKSDTGLAKFTGDGCSSPSSSSSRWWTEVSEVCPLTGFPVQLLPYPPFKFHVSASGGGEAAQLIDGPFLVLKVLSTWRFEALGRPLTPVDIRAIDAYMKRCKLGPFRLGRAIELMGENTSEARKELESLRERACRKFECLKHIQRVRLSRGEGRGGSFRGA